MALPGAVSLRQILAGVYATQSVLIKPWVVGRDYSVGDVIFGGLAGWPVKAEGSVSRPEDHAGTDRGVCRFIYKDEAPRGAASAIAVVHEGSGDR